MDPRLCAGSSSKVFLTETKSFIDYPVDVTQHALDMNPEFAKFLKDQQTAVTSLYATGVTLTHNRPVTQNKQKDRGHASVSESEIKERQEADKKAELARREEQWRAAFEAQKELEKARQVRSWNKMNTKIVFKEPGADYYAQTPLKPGAWFWKALLTNKSIPPSRLRIQIPETLAIFDDLHWAYTDSSTEHLIVTDDFGIGSVYKSFEKYKSGIEPCAVLRIPTSPVSEMKALLLNWFDLGDKVLKSQLPDVGIIQRLVRCHGARPTIIRLFFIAETKKNKATYAYSISNTDAAMKNYYNGKYVVCADYYDGIEITPQYGTALKAVSDAGDKVVEYLQLAYYVRFEEIVLDFVRDEENRVWLLSCKGFRIDMAVQRLRELKEKREQGKTGKEKKVLREDEMQEQQTAVHCKLCLLQYKSHEMKHRLPFKVLLMFKQHVDRSERKVLDLSHLRVNSPDFLSHWVTVCNICYMLLVHEHELLETEMKLAALLNVPVEHPQLLGSYSYEHPNFMPETMHQWRLLFYFQQMQCRTPVARRRKAYIQFKFFDQFHAYKLQMKWDEYESPLNVSRLHYFFAVKNADVLRFCQDTVVHFRLTRSKKWGDVLAVGECRPLSLFCSQLPDSSAVVQAFEVLMFQEAEIVAAVQLRVGFACDKALRVKELPVTIKRFGHLYIPEPSFFTSDSLPDAWMEAFEPDYRSAAESKLIDSSMELEEMYTPTMDLNTPHLSPIPTRPSLFSKGFRASSAHLSPKLSIPLLLDSSPVPQKSTEVSTGRKTLTTEPSTRVLYSTDSITKLTTPTFLSPRKGMRWDGIPHKDDSIAAESIEDLKELIGDVKADEGDVKRIFRRFVGKKGKKKGRKTVKKVQSTEALKPLRTSRNYDLFQARSSLQQMQSLNQHSTSASLRRYLMDLEPYTSFSPQTVKTARV